MWRAGSSCGPEPRGCRGAGASRVPPDETPHAGLSAGPRSRHPALDPTCQLGAMAGWRGYEELARWLDKDLSPALEYMTRDQLAVLLHAMHLGDGDKHDRLQSWTQRTYCIGTARRLLADRLQSLCVRRGMRCNISMDPRPERTQTYWHIHVRVDRDYRTVTGRTAAAREPGRPTLRETGGARERSCGASLSRPGRSSPVGIARRPSSATPKPLAAGYGRSPARRTVW